MHRRIAALVALLALSTAAAVPTAATAARRRPRPAAKAIRAPTTNQVLRNCASSRTGLLTRPYSVRVLRQTRKRVTGDLAEYSNCLDAVKSALRRARSKIVVGIRVRSGGRYVAGQIVVRDRRGRVVDAVNVRAGKRVTVGVPRGTYKLQDGRKRGCTRTVRIGVRRTLATAITCSR